jgi:hypothetical protein
VSLNLTDTLRVDDPDEIASIGSIGVFRGIRIAGTGISSLGFFKAGLRVLFGRKPVELGTSIAVIKGFLGGGDIGSGGGSSLGAAGARNAFAVCAWLGVATSMVRSPAGPPTASAVVGVLYVP